MNVIMSRDQFKPARIGENLVLNDNVISYKSTSVLSGILFSGLHCTEVGGKA